MTSFAFIRVKVLIVINSRVSIISSKIQQNENQIDTIVQSIYRDQCLCTYGRVGTLGSVCEVVRRAQHAALAVGLYSDGGRGLHPRLAVHLHRAGPG